MPKLTIARHSTGEIIDIESAKNGLACDCVCLCCNERVIARQGKINKGWSFAHESGAECAGALETALHKAAKDIIEKESVIYIGEYHAYYENVELLHEYEMEKFYSEFKKSNPKSKISKIEYFSSSEIKEQLELAQKRCTLQRLTLTDVEKEKKAEGSVRVPDVTATYKKSKIYIEIVVTNECDQAKIEDLKLLGVPTFQIDISELRKKELSLNDIRDAIVNPSEKLSISVKRKWIVKPKYIQEADYIAQEFKTAALLKLIDLRQINEQKKLARALRTTEVYFLNRLFRIEQYESWANIWIPRDRMNSETVKLIASALKEFKAKGEYESWTINGSNVEQRLKVVFERLTNERDRVLNCINN